MCARPVSSIHLVASRAAAQAGEAAAAGMPYYYDGWVRDLDVGGSTRSAIVITAPTLVTQYFQVPAGGRLRLSVGSPSAPARPPRAVVRITPEGGSAHMLWNGRVSATWRELELSLARSKGKIAELDVTALGQGVVGQVQLRAFSALSSAPAACDAHPRTRSVQFVIICPSTRGLSASSRRVRSDLGGAALGDAQIRGMGAGEWRGKRLRRAETKA